MLVSHHNIEPPARRKRPTISCRECHRRKQKCDRRQPCAHCLRRGKTDACLYELDAEHVLNAFAPDQLQDQPTNSISQGSSELTPADSSVMQDEIRQMGYGDNAKGTPGIIRILGESAEPLPYFQPRNGSSSNQYASIIRQLPARRHLDILVQDYFNNVAWHYDFVDKATFISQLSQWTHLTHHQLKQGPDALPASLRPFPALLLQVLAQALLYQPAQHNESLDDLKYAADMELSDLAADFSDAGHELASSFRKSELTLTIVQAKLMRACFEKTTGAVIEAWHTLGVAIRDAQELGLHLIEPESTAYSRAEKRTEHDLGCSVWLLLHLWDAHMAVVLGRPMSTRMNANTVSLPMSYRNSSGASGTPRPCDVILCGYHTAYKFLQDIRDLEKVQDWRDPVNNIHETILTNIANLPAWATARRSRQGEPPWLSTALEVMVTNIQFVIFALHRPFIFAEQSSRRKAFHAAMQILESQTRLFQQTEPLQYKSFSLVFATFDAMVLIAAVHIRFPNELKDEFPATKRHLEWGLDRLSILQAGSNHLASSSFKIIERLYRKMMAVASLTQPVEDHNHDSEGSKSAGMEVEVAGVDWDSILPADLGDEFFLQPMNGLLSNGYTSQPLSTDSSNQTGWGLYQFGCDNAGSDGNDLAIDQNATEVQNPPGS